MTKPTFADTTYSFNSTRVLSQVDDEGRFAAFQLLVDHGAALDARAKVCRYD